MRAPVAKGDCHEPTTAELGTFSWCCGCWQRHRRSRVFGQLFAYHQFSTGDSPVAIDTRGWPLLGSSSRVGVAPDNSTPTNLLVLTRRAATHVAISQQKPMTNPQPHCLRIADCLWRRRVRHQRYPLPPPTALLSNSVTLGSTRLVRPTSTTLGADVPPLFTRSVVGRLRACRCSQTPTAPISRYQRGDLMLPPARPPTRQPRKPARWRAQASCARRSPPRWAGCPECVWAPRRTAPRRTAVPAPPPQRRERAAPAREG